MSRSTHAQRSHRLGALVAFDDAFHVVEAQDDEGGVTLLRLEETILGTYVPTAERTVVRSDALEEEKEQEQEKENTPLRATDGVAFVYVDDLEERPSVVAEAYLTDFVVPDGDAFTRGDEDDDFVRATHAAVRAFDRATPSDPGAKRFKRTVEAIEATARARRDEARFAAGEAAL